MIGIGIAFGAIIMTFLLKGVSPMILINMPSIMIVLVGTAGATIASFGMAAFMKFPKLIGIAGKTPRRGAVVSDCSTASPSGMGQSARGRTQPYTRSPVRKTLRV
jgi:hypothetical protein